MTADVELLPLPVVKLDGFTTHDMADYARANVAHATAARDAEIEALRAEVALLRVGAENERLHQRGLLERERERAERLEEALRLIAAPKRPDGTWNRDREACRQIAAEAIAAAQENDDA